MDVLVEEMSPALVQCVPNFSEGIDIEVLELVAESISATGVRLVDWSADIDHNRSVFTFTGPPALVKEAAIASARQAILSIDLRSHRGVHPRLGAIDVLPFVPLLNITLEECASIAKDVGSIIASELSIPVYFYDSASENRATLPYIRKHAFKTLCPDIGPSAPHSTAGAIAIGARMPLIAFNVNLKGSTLAEVIEIAVAIRHAYPNKVRALGLQLASRDLFQVSMNIIAPDQVNLADIVNFIGSRAEVRETELIGAMPGYSAFSVLQETLKLRALKPGQVLLESWPEGIVHSQSRINTETALIMG